MICTITIRPDNNKFYKRFNFEVYSPALGKRYRNQTKSVRDIFLQCLTKTTQLFKCDTCLITCWRSEEVEKKLEYPSSIIRVGSSRLPIENEIENFFEHGIVNPIPEEKKPKKDHTSS